MWSEPGVTEHPDLTGDVAPVPRGPQRLQPLPQARPHVDDPVRHGLDAVPPLAVEGGVLQHGVHYPAPVGRGVGVHRSDDQSHLGPDVSGGGGGG